MPEQNISLVYIKDPKLWSSSSEQNFKLWERTEGFFFFWSEKELEITYPEKSFEKENNHKRTKQFLLKISFQII